MMEKKRAAYANYKRWGVRFDEERGDFSVQLDGMGTVVEGARITRLVSARGPQVTRDDYAAPKVAFSRSEDSAGMTVSYAAGDMLRQDVGLTFTCSDAGVGLHVGGEGTMHVRIEGWLRWGDHDQTETMAVALGRQGYDLRSAYGPAASSVDNALFDRDTDSAFELSTSGYLRLRFDWEKGAYRFIFDTQGADYARALHFQLHKHVYDSLYQNGYKKANPDTTFRTPPVGWMSWYAVQFEAGERTVLQNAQWQAEHLKDYGADTIWVDWEWYHRDFSGVGADDLDMYHPDPVSYPNGLAHVADRIKELGFIPALWIGPTCDPRENELIQRYPEAVMTRKVEWCGQYFLDPSHPRFLDEMLTRMLRQTMEWGYQALKWDCLPNTLGLADACHDTVYGAGEGMSSREVMLGAFRKAREFVGKDFYMLYCAGTTQRDMELACHVFDAARIGGDIFRWEEFITQCIDKVYKYYALHTVMLLADPDNVVLREKFNTLEEAVTRACMVSLLGMPFTLGDHLPDLDEERVKILQRSIPPLPSHPMDIRTGVSDGRFMLINLSIERPDMRYNVLDAVNLSGEQTAVTVDLDRDAHLEPGETYLVYDYWRREYLGEASGTLRLEIGPHASRVLAVHPVLDVPQVLSTSRHVSQGAQDIVSVRYDAQARALEGVSKVVGGDPYEVVVHTPQGLVLFMEGNHMTSTKIEELGERTWRVTFQPEETGEFHWGIALQPGRGQIE